MAHRIEQYALIGDTQSAALVGRDGSIDWACLPRFDSGACFAALLGRPEHGRWLLAPARTPSSIRRRYRGESLILETEYHCDGGVVRVLDFMPPRGAEPDIVRIVEGVSGQVRMRQELVGRFDYGAAAPWIRVESAHASLVAGPDAVALSGDVPLCHDGDTVTAEFTVSEGDRLSFVLVWHPSHQPEPSPLNVPEAYSQTVAFWDEWIGRCDYDGPWTEAVRRSLITLKALTYAPTGGIVAAATTSLPERLGGVRNWDYRFCWLRDATFTLYALMQAGYREEAVAWRDWLLRAVAGAPSQLQIMYGVAGQRRLPELELSWLPGYEDSRPVRIGNAAVDQFQLDVTGEVMDTLHQARRAGLHPDSRAWLVQRAIVEHLETAWTRPDEGIWEVRGPRRNFTHSKVMAWVAVDRAVKAVERFGLSGPVDKWRALRDQIHRHVCERHFNPSKHAFTQFEGSSIPDASLLMLPLVGFLPASDPRILGTIAAVERELSWNGLVLRYPPQEMDDIDGLPGGEGAFLLCTFWLADCYALTGRREEAIALFEHLLSLRSDVGLLAEQYDPIQNRHLGNFPQAFSHVGLINTARNLSTQPGPAAHRRES